MARFVEARIFSERQVKNSVKTSSGEVNSRFTMEDSSWGNSNGQTCGTPEPISRAGM